MRQISPTPIQGSERPSPRFRKAKQEEEGVQRPCRVPDGAFGFSAEPSGSILSVANTNSPPAPGTHGLLRVVSSVALSGALQHTPPLPAGPVARSAVHLPAVQVAEGASDSRASGSLRVYPSEATSTGRPERRSTRRRYLCAPVVSSSEAWSTIAQGRMCLLYNNYPPAQWLL